MSQAPFVEVVGEAGSQVVERVSSGVGVEVAHHPGVLAGDESEGGAVPAVAHRAASRVACPLPQPTSSTVAVSSIAAAGEERIMVGGDCLVEAVGVGGPEAATVAVPVVELGDVGRVDRLPGAHESHALIR